MGPVNVQLYGTHLDALISAATVAPAFPALLHGGVVVALVVVACRGVRVSVDRHAVALMLFKLLVHVAFSSVCSTRRGEYTGEKVYETFKGRVLHLHKPT